MMHALEDCAHFNAIDDRCPGYAVPHSDVCEAHYEFDSVRWHLGHDVTECCACCDGTAEHYDEGEVMAA